MELQGKVIDQTEQRSGTSARGEWVAQDFVIETHDQYPHKMVFSVFGADRLQRFNIQMGQEVNVMFDIDARQYNGRWFNSIRAYDVRPVTPTADAPQQADPLTPFPPQAAPAQPAAPAAAPAAQADPFAAGAEQPSNDDLPF